MCAQAVQTLDAGVKAATPIVEEGIKVATPYVQEAGDALSKVASRCVDPPCHRPLSAQPSARHSPRCAPGSTLGRFARDSLRDVLKALDDVVVD